MPTPLDAWQHRLEAHFGELAASRSASGFPIFALEHGLNHAQLEEITELLRSELAAGERLYLHWLLWVIAFGYTRLQQVNILKSHVGLNDCFSRS
jgi:hypothetical protein